MLASSHLRCGAGFACEHLLRKCPRFARSKCFAFASRLRLRAASLQQMLRICEQPSAASIASQCEQGVCDPLHPRYSCFAAVLLIRRQQHLPDGSCCLRLKRSSVGCSLARILPAGAAFGCEQASPASNASHCGAAFGCEHLRCGAFASQMRAGFACEQCFALRSSLRLRSSGSSSPQEHSLRSCPRALRALGAAFGCEHCFAMQRSLRSLVKKSNRSLDRLTNRH